MEKIALNYLVVILLLGTLLVVSCKESDDFEPVTPGPGSGPGVVSQADPDKATESLVFLDKTVHPGDIPGLANLTSPLVDLKIDTDTIFLTGGISARIEILKPVGLSYVIQSLRAQVIGSDNYIEASFDIEAESDSIAIFEIAFDPDSWDPPTTFDLNIVPVNDAGVVLDEFVIPVEIEAPLDYSTLGGCNFGDQLFLSDNGLTPHTQFEWQKTLKFTELGVVNIISLGHANYADATAGGCCSTSGTSYIDPNCVNTSNYRQINYQYGDVIYEDYLHFYQDGFVDGQVEYQSQNIDVANSDFCTNEAIYNYTNLASSYSPPGNYSYQPLEFNPPLIFSNPIDGDPWINLMSFNIPPCALVIDHLEGSYINGWPLYVTAGYGPNTEYVLISKHWMLEIDRQYAEGGGNNTNYDLRMYRRKNTDTGWHD